MDTKVVLGAAGILGGSMIAAALILVSGRGEPQTAPSPTSTAVESSATANTSPQEAAATRPAAQPIVSEVAMEEREPIAPGSSCVGTAIRRTTSINDDGSSKGGCSESLDVNGNPMEFCPTVWEPGQKIEPSQFWANRPNAPDAVCYHGGECFPAADFKFSASCSPKMRS